MLLNNDSDSVERVLSSLSPGLRKKMVTAMEMLRRAEIIG